MSVWLINTHSFILTHAQREA